jgi:hypothetical protein
MSDIEIIEPGVGNFPPEGNNNNTPAPGSSEPNRPNVAKLMSAALAPYHALDGISDKPIYQYRDLLEREDGELRVLKHLPAERAKRFSLHCRAYEAMECFPPHRELAPRYRCLKKAIETKPSSKECKFMLGLLLDGLGIKAGGEVDGWISMAAIALADIDPDGTRKEWMPLAAIARTVRQVVMTHGETYGRPPPISTILQRCESNLCELIMMKREFDSIGLALIDFRKIIKATEDSYPAEGDIW